MARGHPGHVVDDDAYGLLARERLREAGHADGVGEGSPQFLGGVGERLHRLRLAGGQDAPPFGKRDLCALTFVEDADPGTHHTLRCLLYECTAGGRGCQTLRTRPLDSEPGPFPRALSRTAKVLCTFRSRFPCNITQIAIADF